MAFGLYERQYLGIHGLLPPAFMTVEQQVFRIITQLRSQPNDLARYIQLDNLQVNSIFIIYQFYIYIYIYLQYIFYFYYIIYLFYYYTYLKYILYFFTIYIIYFDITLFF